jgi:Alkylmercury lyase
MASKSNKDRGELDVTLRRFIYRHFIRTTRAPSVSEMAKALGCSLREVRKPLASLCGTHAFVQQENGELWRAAPFSAVPTAFTVAIGRRTWYGNCIWDALGIPAMLGKNARIDASCGCCNFEMRLELKEGRLLGPQGIIHIAVPARDWYKDIVFT